MAHIALVAGRIGKKTVEERGFSYGNDVGLLTDPYSMTARFQGTATGAFCPVFAWPASVSGPRR